MELRYIKLFFIIILGAALHNCEDVDIDNFDDPNLDLTLSNANDYPSILSGAYLAWWRALHLDSPYMVLSVAADHGSSSWGDFGMQEVGTVIGEPYGLGAHLAINNTQANRYNDWLTFPWYGLYSSISTANDVLRGIRIDGNLVNGSQQDSDRTVFQALLIRGMSYGYLGMLYDQGFVVYEDTDLTAVSEENLVDYGALQQQALADLQEAVALGETMGAALNVTQFNGLTLEADQAMALANSYMAKFLVQTPRTAVENESIDWGAVRNYAENGIDFDFAPFGDGGNNWVQSSYFTNDTWMRVDQKLVNMMDPAQPYPFPESGSYEVDLSNMPDDRIGDTGSGAYIEYAGAPLYRPDRGLYFFSYFKFEKHDEYRLNLSSPMLTFPEEDNNLLLAEALIHLEVDIATACELINNTRVGNGGLSPAVVSDTDLLDKLFYERYLEAYEGPGSPFFDRRRTDDLGEAQFRQMPIPAIELSTLGIPLYTFGGN